jgi:single-strand DNA-binding protein
MLNQVVLIGRLTADPEAQTTQSGIQRTRIRLAVDRAYRNQQGERQTDFIDVVCWRRLAETVSQYMRKGRLVAVSGRLQVRRYQTQDGQSRTIYEVVADTVKFLDRGGEGRSPAPSSENAPPQTGRAAEPVDEDLPPEPEGDDLPF